MNSLIKHQACHRNVDQGALLLTTVKSILYFGRVFWTPLSGLLSPPANGKPPAREPVARVIAEAITILDIGTRDLLMAWRVPYRFVEERSGV